MNAKGIKPRRYLQAEFQNQLKEGLIEDEPENENEIEKEENELVNEMDAEMANLE